MPKMKTKKAAAKRFMARGSGSIKRGHATKRHILTKRTTKNKRQFAWNPHCASVRPEAGSRHDALTRKGDRPCLELNVESPRVHVTKKFLP